MPKNDQTTMLLVIDDVITERERQNQKWGVQQHSMDKWFVILMEEIGEIAQALQNEEEWSKKGDKSNVYEEIIHAEAVLNAMAEQVRESLKS